MNNFRRLFLLSMIFLFGAMSSYAYEQGDTIIIPSDRAFSVKIEAEWFDADSSYKVSDLSVPTISEENGISYVNTMPSDMILVYNVDVQGKGGEYKYIFRYRNVRASGNIRIWIDGDYSIPGFENRGAVQRSLPADITGEWEDFTHTVSFDLTPGKHQIGIQVNKSGCYELDYITVVPVNLIEVGFPAELTVSATNGLVSKSPDYDTAYVVGDVVEFTAMPEDNYFFYGWSGDTVSTVNPLPLLLDTTNNLKATFYRNVDTFEIAADRYAPVAIEAEDLSLFLWGRDAFIDSVFYIGSAAKNNYPFIEKDGHTVMDNVFHGSTIYVPVNVAAEGKFRINYNYIRKATGSNHGFYIYVDDVRVNNDVVLETTGNVDIYMTSSNSAAFLLTPGVHTIGLKPNGGSNKFYFDKVTIVPDSLAVVDAQTKISAGLGGSVAKTPDYGTNYVVGDSLTLEATPDFGFLFGAWSGDVTSNDNPLKLKLDSGMTIVANFVDDPDISNYKVTATAKDSGDIVVSPALDEYVTGNDITLTATAKFGYIFTGWTGDIVSIENPVVIDSIAKDYAVEANFELLPTYAITLDDVYGMTTISPVLDAYPEGTKVVLTAGQTEDYRFAYWNDDTNLTAKTLEIVVMSDTAVKVSYEMKEGFVQGDYHYINADEYKDDTIQAEWYDLDLSEENYTTTVSSQELMYDTVAGTDTVFVTRTGNGVGMGFPIVVGNEGGEFVLDYYYKRVVAGDNNVKIMIDGSQISSAYAELAVPATEVGVWSKGTASYTLKLTPGKHILRLQFHYSDRHDVDYFTLSPVPGTIAVEGGLVLSYDEARGSVSQTPYKLVYDKGEEVTLVPTPLEGFMFKEWKGDFASTESTVTFKMDSTIRVEGVFVPAYKVSINEATINGTVTVNPQQDLYEGGDTVTFVPVPDQGYKFDGWYADGGVSGDTIPLEIVVSNHFDLTAYFSQLSYRLVATAGDGGSVVKDPSRISYTAATVVTLTATADATYEFVGWTGDVTSTENPLVVTMDSAITVQAAFQAISALDEINGTALGVYPNPSTGVFTVEAKEQVSYVVYDLSGAMVINGSANAKFELDMSRFSKGIYTLQVVSDHGSSVQRLILK